MIASMARASLIIIIFLFAAVSASDSSPVNSTSTMILPLFFNSHSNHDYTLRRRLQTSPNARMFLHDDLLLNGYYTTRLWIGTPPQRFALIVDTGSTVTYVPCSTCEQCGNHQDPKFQPQLSSTYQPVKCNIDCTCDSGGKQCTYDRQYAEMSSSSGVLGEDTVSFGNQSGLEPQRAVFGCENMETGDLYSQHADGIMGLGRGDLSIVDQLVEKGVINDSFSICYGGMDVGGGAMVLGGLSPPADMVFSPSDPNRSPYYNVELKEMHVAGKKLAISPKVFDGKHGTVLDSGTTYAYLPEAAFGAFKDAIFKELHLLKRIPGPDPNYNDICFSGAGSDSSQLSETFPSVEMVFTNGQKLLLSPENYLFRHSKVRGSYCLGIFQNGKDPTTLLGGIVVRNTLVTYDREHQKIGFWKTNCSNLWERLHMAAGSPPVSETGKVNSTVDIAPTPAPSGSAPNQDPGQMKIGFITFSMLLSMKFKDLKPHLSELPQLLAKELNLNASQVQWMNLTSRDNDTLLKWTIFPEESAGYFSNATAMDIISKLKNNLVHLPDSYGSYKLLQWTIKPPPERRWWEKHNMVVVAGVSAISLLVVLGCGGALIVWKRRKNGYQSLVSYKPIESSTASASIVAEQELQPLQKSTQVN